MIIGVDIGNYITKTSEYHSFLSKCSTLENRYQSSKNITRDGKTIYLEEGSWDTEYRKCKKENYMDFLLYAISKSSSDMDNQVVVGLPISQYKTDKEELKDLILTNKINYFQANGKDKRVIISDCEVFAEGIAAVADTDFYGIILDIGGRTTDIALVEDINGRKKITNPFSMPVGTLNLYTDFIKALNSKYGLDLNLSDNDRILRDGLNVDGEPKDISFAMEIFKIYVDDIVKSLQLEYSLRTNNIIAIGGGAAILYKSLKRRIKQLQLIEDPLYANALGYKRVGEDLWL